VPNSNDLLANTPKRNRTGLAAKLRLLSEKRSGDCYSEAKRIHYEHEAQHKVGEFSAIAHRTAEIAFATGLAMIDVCLDHGVKNVEAIIAWVMGEYERCVQYEIAPRFEDPWLVHKPSDAARVALLTDARQRGYNLRFEVESRTSAYLRKKREVRYERWMDRGVGFVVGVVTALLGAWFTSWFESNDHDTAGTTPSSHLTSAADLDDAG
jgi:hypothetical protein